VPEAAAIDPLIGKTPLGQYRILEKLGVGGFGAAYLAEQTGVQRKAVIKVLHRQLLESEEVVRRFEREAAVLAALDHHHIVRLYSCGALGDGRLFLAMEYGGDKTLENEIRQSGHFDPDRALRIAGQVCEALQEAHDHGVVHRDLKPANILLGLKGTQDWIKVVDVGIARIVQQDEAAGPRLTRSGAIIGTPAYFSPEQARGLTVDGRSDLYSLGVSLYEMLTGALPVRGATPMDFVRAHCMDAPTPMTRYAVNLPGFVEDVIFKALEKNPDHRYQTATEMGEALADARARLHATAQVVEQPRNRKLWYGVLGSAAAVLAAAGLLTRLSISQPPGFDVEVAAVAAPPAVGSVKPPPAPPAEPPSAPANDKMAAKESSATPTSKNTPVVVASVGPAVAPAADREALRLANVAEHLAAAKDAKGAIAKFEQVLQLQPGRALTAKALRGLAILNERTGDSESALKYYLRYRPLAPASERDSVEARVAALQAELELEPGR
jgi:serine/threonine-protein kinase